MIELLDVYKIYDEGENEVRALDGVSFRIEKGEFVAIVGKSGSGKSTCMNIIGALDVPTRGTYKLNGTDVSFLSDNDLAEIRNKTLGFVFQQYNLISKNTIFENVELPLIYQGRGTKERREKTLEALERVGLRDREKHMPNQLSGGQQQRVSIARALVADPPVILADEPTGALDSKTGKDVMKFLVDLHEKGKTIILITHDNTIAECARRIIRIHDGKVVSDEPNVPKLENLD